MRVVWKCPCDRSFGTSHTRDFAIEGGLSRLLNGVRQVYDWRRFCEWLTTEGPATEITIDGVLVWKDGQWLIDQARSSCIDRTDQFIEYLLERPHMRGGCHGQAKATG